MTVEISRVKTALFYLEADLEWLNQRINDDRAQDFQVWVSKLDFGVPKNLSADIAAYQAEMKPYFDTLLTLRDKLQAEKDGIENTIAVTQVAVTDEVRKYLPEEGVIEPIAPIGKG